MAETWPLINSSVDTVETVESLLLIPLGQATLNNDSNDSLAKTLPTSQLGTALQAAGTDGRTQLAKKLAEDVGVYDTHMSDVHEYEDRHRSHEKSSSASRKRRSCDPNEPWLHFFVFC